MADSTPKQEPPYGLRMPPDLKARVKAAADSAGRSMNAEIVATLERQYPAAGSIQSLRSAIAERLPLLARSYNEEEERRLEAEILDLIRLIEVAASGQADPNRAGTGLINRLTPCATQLFVDDFSID